MQGNTAAPFTISSPITDNGGTPVGLTKGGPGALLLTGSNTFTGPISVSGGTLQMGDGTPGHDTLLAGNIANNGAVVLNMNANQTYGGTISGGGSLTKGGTGTLTLAQRQYLQRSHHHQRRHVKTATRRPAIASGKSAPQTRGGVPANRTERFSGVGPMSNWNATIATRASNFNEHCRWSIVHRRHTASLHYQRMAAAQPTISNSGIAVVSSSLTWNEH